MGLRENVGKGLPKWGKKKCQSQLLHPDIFPTMPFSSRPKKITPKGVVRELHLVETVSRRGRDVYKAEEVTTPHGRSKKAQSTSRQQNSSSPTKRRKLEPFDEEPIPFDIDGHDGSGKRQTMVFWFFI